MQTNPYTIQSSKTVYQNQRTSVREDSVTWPNGTSAVFDVIETNDSVAIVAINDQEEICLINVYQHTAAEWAWKLPGGIGDGAGPIHSAMHQLAQTTGFVANEYAHISSLRLHGSMTEKMQVVVMRRLVQTGEDHKEEAGVGEVGFQTLEAIDKLVADNEINDAGTIAAISVYKNWSHQSTPTQA